MILPLEVQKEINDFYEDISLFGINHDFSEFQFSRAKTNYSNVLKKLEKIDLSDPMRLTYSVLSLDELTTYLNEILCRIFGTQLKDRITHYNSLLKLENIDNPFDAVVESNCVLGEQVPVSIYISKKCYSIQVVSTGHEYVHCMLSKYDTDLFNKKINNVHYKEFLSILVEYIICFELSKILKDEKLEEKHDLIRMFHDKEQALERRESVFLQSRLDRFNPIDAYVLRRYIDYQEHNSFSYILADLYSIYLMDAYKNNSGDLIKFIKSIIDGDKCINDLIKYFNLSLRNTDVIKRYNNTMDRVALTKHL